MHERIHFQLIPSSAFTRTNKVKTFRFVDVSISHSLSVCIARLYFNCAYEMRKGSSNVGRVRSQVNETDLLSIIYDFTLVQHAEKFSCHRSTFTHTAHTSATIRAY